MGFMRKIYENRFGEVYRSSDVGANGYRDSRRWDGESNGFNANHPELARSATEKRLVSHWKRFDFGRMEGRG